MEYNLNLGNPYMRSLVLALVNKSIQTKSNLLDVFTNIEWTDKPDGALKPIKDLPFISQENGKYVIATAGKCKFQYRTAYLFYKIFKTKLKLKLKHTKQYIFVYIFQNFIHFL